MVVVVNCRLVVLLSPMHVFASMDMDKELIVGSVGLAVDVHHTLHCLSSVVHPLAEGEIDLDVRIFVLG